MTSKAPAPADPKSATITNNQTKPRPKTQAGPAPVEEPFWHRYSPHHEFPLSSATSIALHVLALVFLIVAGWFVANLLEKSKLEVDTLEMAGGGGSPHGEGNAPGDRPPAGGTENVESPRNEQETPSSPTPAADLKKPILDPLDVVLDDPNGRTIDQANQAVKNLEKLRKDVRSKLFNSLGPGLGKAGSGTGGGKDTGKDKGEGPYSGPGKNKFTSRQKRLLRWVMQFNTFDGNDYRRQLAGLGAILAFPQADGSYMVYRDLNQRPAKGKIEDINGIKRIFWSDDKRKSIESLSEALGVPVPDEPIIAFFPVELENELLKKELNYKNKKEDDIKETRFKVNFRGGKYVPEVTEQYY
jgi:hypothetical protein